MTVRALLLVGQTPGRPVRWAVAQDGALSAAGVASSLGALETLPPHDELVAVLPGETCATRALRLPVPERQVEAAARLAFEDLLAEPAGGFDLAWSAAGADGLRLVTAAPRGLAEGWLADLAEVGLDPDILTVDHAVLAAQGHDGVVLRERGRVIAALPGGGLTVPEDFAASLLPAMTGDATVLSVRIGPGGEKLDTRSLVLADERALGAFVLQGLEQHRPPNLRRGPLARRRRVGDRLRGLRLAGGLMAACLALWVATDLLQAARYGGAARQLRQEAETEFAAAYPNARIIDLRRQAARRAGQSGGGDFLPLTASLTEALRSTGESVELSGLSYDGERLTADLRYRDYAQLEALTAALRARGLTAREGSNPRRDETGAYVDRLVLEAGA